MSRVPRTEIPGGWRVHHRGCLWNYGFTDAEAAARPSRGWATVVEAMPQRDRTTEYRVRLDAPVAPGGSVDSQWASYHIDEWRPTDATTPKEG